jgi:predicted hotdog family 3-hydroxylacyl-ACP dehydratase
MLIRDLIPHQGAMCLLEQVVSWGPDAIDCRARSHLSLENPLRRAGRLSAVCGIEYGLQAAALHGALVNGVRQGPGYLASLRDVTIEADRLDDPEIGVLEVGASLVVGEASALIYLFRLRAEGGRALLSGRAIIALPGGAKR